MATFISTTVKNFSYTGASTHTATRDITAGDCVVACVSWENVETLDSVTDSAGGTWVVATQQAHPGTPAMPIGGIAYCLSHPGGTGVVVTANFSGTAGAILSMNLMCFRPAGGTSFAYDAVATPGTGFGTTFSTGSSISTADAGFVVQYVAGYQFASSVAAGGTPTFTRDTDTESGSATDFAQYLLSSSAQTVTPGASWGSGGNEWVMLALAIKEVAGGGFTPRQLLLGVG